MWVGFDIRGMSEIGLETNRILKQKRRGEKEKGDFDCCDCVVEDRITAEREFLDVVFAVV